MRREGKNAIIRWVMNLLICIQMRPKIVAILWCGGQKLFNCNQNYIFCSSANYNYVSDVIINVIFMQNPLIYDFICSISGRCRFRCTIFAVSQRRKLTGQIINNIQTETFQWIDGCFGLRNGKRGSRVTWMDDAR